MKDVFKKRNLFNLRYAAIVAISVVLITVGAPLVDSASGSGLYHTVTFVENDNSSDPVFATQSANAPTPLTLIVNVSPAFSNVGFTFDDWNTSPDGSGTSYGNGASYPFAVSAALYAIWTGISHTVTFIENDSATDPVYSTQSANVPTPLTVLSNINPPIVHPGYSFIDWNTAADGSGTSYANGAVFNFSQPTGLFAIWQVLPTVTQSFAANGGTGVVASMTNQAGDSTTLPLSSGMTNPGYSFAGWNTAADGSGTQYAGGATFTFTGSQVLYAQWIPDVYSITYAYDGGLVGATSAVYTVGSSPLLLPNATSSGFTFAGWFTESTGGALVGLAGSAITPIGSSTFYAQWVQIAAYSVIFSANGAIGSIASINGEVNSSIVLPTVTGLSNSGFAFSGWNTSADGSGTQYAGGSTYVVTGAQTLFAQWILGPSDTLTFNANGGSGSVAPIIGAPGSTVTLPDQSGLIMSGFLMSEWNTSPKGTGKSYSFGQALRLTSSAVLYAQWKGHKPVTLFGAVGSFKKNSSSLSLALKNQIDRIALTVKAKKYSTVTLYGYTATTGLVSLNMSLSRARAQHVAQFLRLRLNALRVKGVTIRAAGEGAIVGESSSEYSRVEIFGV
jgi:uncharacterized repeat protein (TIGR02543 family)